MTVLTQAMATDVVNLLRMRGWVRDLAAHGRDWITTPKLGLDGAIHEVVTGQPLFTRRELLEWVDEGLVTVDKHTAQFDSEYQYVRRVIAFFLTEPELKNQFVRAFQSPAFAPTLEALEKDFPDELKGMSTFLHSNISVVRDRAMHRIMLGLNDSVNAVPSEDDLDAILQMVASFEPC